jgi:hypothetical protein
MRDLAEPSQEALMSGLTTGALTLLVLLGLGTDGAKAEEGYIGTWGTGPAQCALGQEEEDAPLIMTATGYKQHKVQCRFKSVTAMADTLERSPETWRVSAECSTGGSNEAYEFTLLLQENSLTFRDNNGDRVLERCP